MYRVVFNGQLLDGFSAAAVRAAVAERLQLGSAQVERLFSGRTVVLKKAVSQEDSGPYLSELQGLGMDARLEALDEGQDVERSLATFKVVFWGKLLRGYDKALVMRAVTRRLRVGPQQLVQMFAGGKVVLKRRVNAETGARYVTELARIGMLVELEVETEAQQPAGSFALQPVTLPATDPVATVPSADDAFSALLRTQLDMSQAMRTSLVQSEVLGSEEPQPEEGVVPDFTPKGIVVPPPSGHAVSAAPPVQSTPYNSLQIKCPQCGRHQLPGPRCRTCGLVLDEMGRNAAAAKTAAPKTQRMDTSAYGAVTTLMQGLRNAVAPSPAAAAAPGAGIPTWMFRMRDDLAQQQESPSRLQRKHLVGIAAVVGVLVLWVLFH